MLKIGAKGPCDVILVGAAAPARKSFFAVLQQLEATRILKVRAVVEPPGPGLEAARAAFPAALCVGTFDAAVVPPGALAIITTPARLHLTHTNSALKRGWHVLCSLPLAPSTAEATHMIAAAQRQERLLAVDLRFRLFPAAIYLRTLCRDQLLGPLLNFRLAIGPRSPAQYDAATEKLAAPDGALTALGIPALDLLGWWLGSASLVSYADDAMGGVEATSAITLTFRDGVRGAVHLSQERASEDTYAFVFERGIVHWMAQRIDALTLQIASTPFALRGDIVPPLSAGDTMPSTPPLSTETAAGLAQLENLVAAIAGRRTLRTPASEALPVLRLTDECYARRTPLPQPWFSHNDAAHARTLSPPPARRQP